MSVMAFGSELKLWMEKQLGIFQKYLKLHHMSKNKRVILQSWEM
jgi:hypothetical protein